MTQTRWAVHGPEGAILELAGRKFSSNDDGAPMMCNVVCRSMGRHVHIDYCRADEFGLEPFGPCGSGASVQHINDRMLPDPDKPKDVITHSLYWRRMGPLHAVFLEISSNLIRLPRSQDSEVMSLPVLHFLRISC